MKTKAIKFSNKIQGEFVDEMRKKVKEYFDEKKISKFGNTNMKLKTIFMFSLYLFPYFLLISGTVQNPVVVPFLWILMGLGMAGIGLSVMHDANHKSYSKNKHINKVLSYTLYLLGGFPKTWQYQHNTLHHSYTNIDGYDEDIDPGSVLRLSPYKPHFKIHKVQHFYAWFLYGLMTLTWTTNKDFKQLFRYHNSDAKLDNNNSIGLLLSKLIISKILYYTYILIIPIVLLPIPWWTVLAYYILMHFICGLTLGMIFLTAHVMPTSLYPNPMEDGTIENNWAVHQLMTTTNYAPKNRFFSWFIGGLNYQIEHHLFPNICHVHYRGISNIIKETAEKHKIPYHVQPTFLIALRKHFSMLKVLGTGTMIQNPGVLT